MSHDRDEEVRWTARRRFWHRLIVQAENARALGDRARAIACLEAALDHAVRLKSYDWRPLARTLHALGRAVEESGDLDRALGLFEELAEHERTHLPPTDPKRTPALTRLAWVHLAAGRREEAEEALAALEVISAALLARDGEQPPDLLEALSLRMIGELTGALDHRDRAIVALERAVHDLERCQPPSPALLDETRRKLRTVSRGTMSEGPMSQGGAGV